MGETTGKRLLVAFVATWPTLVVVLAVGQNFLHPSALGKSSRERTRAAADSGTRIGAPNDCNCGA